MPSLSAPINTRKEYDDTLALLVKLLNEEDEDHPHPDVPNLLSLVKAYENEHFPIGFPNALSTIKFEMDQSELSVRDIAPCFGSIRKARDVLAGRSALTLSMARSLHEAFQIPADVLLGEPGKTFNPNVPTDELEHFPWNEIRKKGWVTKWERWRDRLEEMYIEMARLEQNMPALSPTFLRQSGGYKPKSDLDKYAVQAWCMRVANVATDIPTPISFQTGSVTDEFMRTVAKLSIYDDGPLRAQKHLHNNGIHLVTESHLPKTRLDGASFLLQGKQPVIGLTLRLNRLDNFWFTLMHELAHVRLHLDIGSNKVFIDESIISSTSSDPIERAADSYATESLIPSYLWESSPARCTFNPMDAYYLSQEAGVHLAVVAGRIRYENNEYNKLSQFVGQGEVKSQFWPPS